MCKKTNILLQLSYQSYTDKIINICQQKGILSIPKNKGNNIYINHSNTKCDMSWLRAQPSYVNTKINGYRQENLFDWLN